MPAKTIQKIDPAAPLVQSRIKASDKVPFVARCGSVLCLVNSLEEFAPKLILLRVRIVQGKHFSDCGDYGPGDEVTIGPITNHWRRISLPILKRSKRKPIY